MHQAPTRDTTSSSDPSFNNNLFEEKYNGWLKKYYYAIIIFFFVNLSGSIHDFRLGVHYLGNPEVKSVTNNLNSSGVWDSTTTTTYYSTVVYGISLIVLSNVAVLAGLGLFFQFQAIRLRSIQKQKSAIKFFTFFVIGQTGAAIFSIVSAIFTTPISWVSALIAGVVLLAFGVAFRFLAVKILNIMMRRDEKSFKFDGSALHV